MKIPTGRSIRALLLAAVLASRAALPLHAQAIPDRAPVQEEAPAQSLLAPVADHERAWNTQHVGEWAEVFSHDSDVRNRRGEWLQPGGVNVEDHATFPEKFAGRGTTKDLEAEIVALDLLASGLALVHRTLRLVGAAPVVGAVVPVVLVLLLVPFFSREHGRDPRQAVSSDVRSLEVG